MADQTEELKSALRPFAKYAAGVLALKEKHGSDWPNYIEGLVVPGFEECLAAMKALEPE